MKGACICIQGFEDVTKEELESLGCRKVKMEKGFVTFDVDEPLGLAKVAYKSKTTSRTMQVLDEISIHKGKSEMESDLRKSCDKLKFSKIIGKDSTFKVECERTGEHEFTSFDVEMTLGRIIIENIEKSEDYKPKASMDNPDIKVFAYIIDDNCVFGIDYCGFDTSKRDYHIFISKTSIKGTVAAALVLYAKVPSKKVILDPFSCSGTIAIEAALLSEDVSAHKFKREDFAFKRILKVDDWNKVFDDFDKSGKSKNYHIIATDPILANTRSTTKNAKIAGVQKDIEASRVDIEWIDTKIDKNSVNFVITKLPSVSRVLTEKDIRKVYKEFFYQLEYITKKDVKMIILIADETIMVESAKEYKFELENKKDIMIGKQPAKVVTLVKG